MQRAIAILCLTLIYATPHEKGKMMLQRASGSFEVKLEPMSSDVYPRLKLSKQFHGDLEGTSAGEMMSVEGEVEGSGAYAAIERFTGTLRGR